MTRLRVSVYSNPFQMGPILIDSVVCVCWYLIVKSIDSKFTRWRYYVFLPFASATTERVQFLPPYARVFFYLVDSQVVLLNVIRCIGP